MHRSLFKYRNVCVCTGLLIPRRAFMYRCVGAHRCVRTQVCIYAKENVLCTEMHLQKRAQVCTYTGMYLCTGVFEYRKICVYRRGRRNVFIEEGTGVNVHRCVFILRGMYSAQECVCSGGQRCD